MSTSAAPGPKRNLGLIIGALGVVYGDIGTSPLYAFKESLHASHGHGHSPEHAVYGLLSLILWALILIVSIKYVCFVLRADHHGEGGILALLGVLLDFGKKEGGGSWVRRMHVFTLLGVAGAALLYGDGIITPAISVLSAVEGLGYATPALGRWIVPISLAILVTLFLCQRFGTGSVGRVFGPVMLAWFGFLAVTGAWNLCGNWSVLWALNPLPGIRFLIEGGFTGFLVLGSVFLAVTGAEALYADLGHFGKGPIRSGWQWLVLPALALNYLGQGATVLRDPSAAENPFYAAVPGWALYPAILLATAATVIASQALISGAFSLTLQAIQLGYCPRLAVRHTSHSQRGQVYIPDVNWALMAGCVALVLIFRSSGALASAYGIAVTLTMLLTTALFAAVARRVWKWSLLSVAVFVAVFAAVELCFFAANAFKILSGGWFALLAAGIVFLLMSTWKAGRRELFNSISPSLLPLEKFLSELEKNPPVRVPGCAVFLASNAGPTPMALLQNMRHNKVLHETVILLSVKTEMQAFLDDDTDTIEVRDRGFGIYSVQARYGYMETPNVPLVVSLLPDYGVGIHPRDITFFLSRERIMPAASSRLGWLRRALFGILARNAAQPTDFFCLPPGRVVELGMQVQC